MLSLTSKDYAILAAAGAGCMAFGAWLAHRRTRSLRRDCLRIFAGHAKAVQEIHDSLLQGFIGISWHMDAAASLLPGQPEASKEKIRELLVQLDHILHAARQDLWDLKRNPWLNDDFPSSLRQQAESAFRGTAPLHVFRIEGRPFPVRGEVAHSIAFIAREAWSIAKAFPDTRCVVTHVSFLPDCLRLSIAMEPLQTPTQELVRLSNWSLLAMQRRAQTIQAELDFKAAPSIPAHLELHIERDLAIRHEYCSRWRNWWQHPKGRIDSDRS